jgi:beta-lactamase superfamily II metal-dependent hydrolase
MVSSLEIDFLPVGEGEHSGDAIAVRWVDNGAAKVLVYDGGTKASGRALVDHVRWHYGTTHVDYVVNSHPDNDHASGLSLVLEELTVGELWMHQPWNYSAQICDYFHDGRITSESLARRLQDKMAAAYALETLAEKQRIPVYEPFAGSVIGIFRVLSPTSYRYVHELVPAFEKSPELKKAEGILDTALFGWVKEAAQAFVAELWTGENLPETVMTSAENESSAVLFAKIEGRGGYLLTGDAGLDTLRASAEYARGIGIDLPSEVTFVQIPHHGGRHNVSTESLNLLVGTPTFAEAVDVTKTAFVSASEKAPTHPKRKVTNAFRRRGFQVFSTKGKSIRHGFNQPFRQNWGPAEQLPFFGEVEA